MGRRVADVMTGEVVCARLSTPYKELVRLLAERHVSAVGPQASVMEAARLLHKHQIKRLPVTDPAIRRP